MKFTLTKKFILAKVEEKTKMNLYYLLDLENYDKTVVLGARIDETFEERSIVEVDIDMRIQNQRFDLMNGEKKYTDTVSMFLSSIRQTKE
ncbi:hypothetical protein [Bacillus mobilis]|uniref:hypothetical protein n=1 Tax=Bacillus mobilis TaxID=2026190 RepID=UPI002960FE17|nr:hypothetical protein [Bacillus cereus]